MKDLMKMEPAMRLAYMVRTGRISNDNRCEGRTWFGGRTMSVGMALNGGVRGYQHTGMREWTVRILDWIAETQTHDWNETLWRIVRLTPRLMLMSENNASRISAACKLACLECGFGGKPNCKSVQAGMREIRCMLWRVSVGSVPESDLKPIAMVCDRAIRHEACDKAMHLHEWAWRHGGAITSLACVACMADSGNVTAHNERELSRKMLEAMERITRIYQ